MREREVLLLYYQKKKKSYSPLKIRSQKCKRKEIDNYLHRVMCSSRICIVAI